jgi:hypothetical protein
MSDVRTVYQRARIETAKLLGHSDNLDGLSAEQSTRLDVACALRIALDDQAAKVLRGESSDVSKLLSASEALGRLLPPLREPVPDTNRENPRDYMWRTYCEMRARGAAFGEGLDGAKLTIERLRAELAAKDAKIAELEAGGVSAPGRAGSNCGNSAVGDNVVPLREPPSSPAAPPEPAPQPQAARWKDYVNSDGSIRSTPRGRWDV